MPHSKPDRRPVSNPVPSFWLSGSCPLDDYRSSPDIPSSADIVIIGGGFSGIATAYHIIKDNPDPSSIVLLEAREICSGATGRNGGHVKPDTYFNVPRNVSMFGLDAAAELVAFEAANVHAVKNLVESEGLDCDFHLTRAVDVYLDKDHAEKTEAAYRELVGTGAVNLDDTAFIPERDAERVIWPTSCVKKKTN
jgi:glycine/D-amino acid oxidase-like deaminating enzyme